MPLLKKKLHVNEPLPENLRDDEEVFHCSITDEIFRDYDKFADKMLMYNSMVWTCSMTGKSRLTFQEALDSEEHARKSLKDFPVDLRIPVLLLASKTQRTSFSDMAEDVFCFIKDRYFMGENLESSFSGDKWKDSHVLTIIAPSDERLKSITKKSPGQDREFWPPANEFKYEIEHLDAYDKDISEVMIVGFNQIRRKKGTFSREKCKLFLKQHVELDSRGVFVIKEITKNDFGLHKIRFDQIFDGPLPNFEISKKLDKHENGKLTTKKRAKQETLSKYLVQKDGMSPTVKNNNLLESMKKREEEFKLNQQKKIEQRLALKKSNKLKGIAIDKCIKNWYKVQDDLLLDNQKALPVPVPVTCKVPDEHLSEMFSIMEFVQNFSKLLNTKDFFPQGLTLELMERALTETEIAGPFNDLIQMFLTAIFNAQNEESNQYSTTVDFRKNINESKLSENLSVEEASNLATAASRWSKTYQGMNLGHLPLYSVTVTEILRLHLLSSGARITENGSKWRYAQRGGYFNEDDPGLHFCLDHPHILKALAVHDVIQLSIVDKLQIVFCLMHQLMTYAEVRDAIEERVEKSRQLRIELKTLKWGAKKRELEYTMNKQKLKKEFKNDKVKLTEALKRLQKDNDDKDAENRRKIKKTYKSLYDYQTFMGMDRAFRRYLRLDSVPGFFVTIENDSTGECLDTPVRQSPELVEITKSELRNYFRQKLFNNSKSPQKLNGALPDNKNGTLSDEKNGPLPDSKNETLPVNKSTLEELLMCTADPESCPVHSVNKNAPRWAFFYLEDQIEMLLKALNRRGERESELLEILENTSELILSVVRRTPCNVLNPSIDTEEVKQRSLRNPKKDKDGYKDANLGYPSDKPTEEVLESSLVDNILEMEEKIFVGNLGRLDNREEWRTFLTNKNYEELEKLPKRDKDAKKNSDPQNGPDTPESDKNDYKDPGRLLTMNSRTNLDKCSGETDIASQKVQKSITALAFALSQVARALNSKYLKAPLGHINVAKNDRRRCFDVLDKWEESLLAATSYSQVFLHYTTLDSCIMWSKSALLARCKVCRLKKDAENMLLCENCNFGQHLYCLRPALQSVPKGDWYCDKCRKEKEEEARRLNPEPAPTRRRTTFLEEEMEEEQEYESPNESEEVEESDDETDETDEDATVDTCSVCCSAGELLTCEKCLKHFHMGCCNPPLRRPPRGSWNCFKCLKRERDKEKAEEGLNRRNHRNFPLHNVELQELLSDVMKHPDAWPFIRPVQTKDVPDYYEVIRQPMDFGTIKYNLNMGKYTVDMQLMQDVALIFKNCDTYNKSNDEVYKCGAKLLKYFIKRAKELDLQVPKEIEDEDQEIHKAKKRRNK